MERIGASRPVEDTVFRDLLREREIEHGRLREELVDCLKLHLEAHRAYKQRLGQYACLRAVRLALLETERLLGRDEVLEILTRPKDSAD